MSRGCSKKSAVLTWAVLECLFFSSVMIGSTWLSRIFRTDGYFPESCNVTYLNNSNFQLSARSGLDLDVTSSLSAKVKEEERVKAAASRPRCRLVSADHLVMSLNRARSKRSQGTGLGAPTSLSAVSDRDENETDGLVHVIGHCVAQSERIHLMLCLVILVRDVLILPLGIFYDKYGTTRTRLLTVLIFVLGTLMMTFTGTSVPWLVVPALALTGLAGGAVLLTNLQTANLFGRRRHLVMSVYIGATYSNGIISFLMMLSNSNDVNIQTSFMFLTIGIVPMLVSTVAFLPKTRIPWPLPADYGKRRNQSLDEVMLRKQKAWQRRLSEVDGSRGRRTTPQFCPSAVKSLFVVSVLWFGVHRLHADIMDGRIVTKANVQLTDFLDLETFHGIIQFFGIAVSPLAGLLIDRHVPRDLSSNQATQQMRRIVPAIAVTSLLSVLEVTADMFVGTAFKVISIVLSILHKVFAHTTMCAFIMHSHFSHQHLGKYFGLTYAVSAVMAAFQFPVEKFLSRGDQGMLPAHILLLVLALLSFAHPINAWDQCRKRLIHDQSDSLTSTSGPRNAHVHIETDDINMTNNKNNPDPEVNKTDPVPDERINKQLKAERSAIELQEVTYGKNGGPAEPGVGGLLVQTPITGTTLKEVDEEKGLVDEDMSKRCPLLASA